ncbi:MAG TPA: winged-helix domain-containing protein [Rhodothermales bacterium]
MAIATQGLLPQPALSENYRIVIVADDDAVFQAVRLAYALPDTLERFASAGLVDEHHVLSPHGELIVERAGQADVVLVEWRLDLAPAINTLGFHLRLKPDTPLIALCRNGFDEEVAALAAGCDAAITFPLKPALLQGFVLAHRRLVAAVRAERPAESDPASGARHDVQVFGPLRINRTACRLYVNDTEVQLTPREYSLLDFLLSRPERLCTRDEILNRVWGINFDTGTNMVDVYMYFLRRKLEAHAAAGMIQTVRGRGYRLALAADRAPGSTSKKRPAGASADGP